MSEIIEINSGLQSVLLIERITTFDLGEIRGVFTFDGKRVFMLIEAMAQLGAFHVRRLDGFQRHAFLMKVGKCVLPEPLPEEGAMALQGELTGRSDRSFVYHVQVGRQGQTAMRGDFWFSTVDYDERFEGEKLRKHYEKVFLCLTSASGIA